jgi:PhoPQ-activated pathogenicity-related protein
MKYIRNFILLTWFLLVFQGCDQDTAYESHYESERPGHPFAAYLSESHPSYSWELENSIENDGYTTYVIRMVSQEWLNEDLVNKPEWWHWITIVVPDHVDHTTALLWIGGGTDYTDKPTSASEFLVEAAQATNSVTFNLHNVPFQPVSFAGDDLEQRYEDDLIAYGWREFMESGAADDHAKWLARFPMTAAAMRAMDTVSEFSSDHLAETIDKYVVAGASKRGWTTWTTAIFDDRVIAIAPAVIDLLNMLPSFEHHWQAYGEWSPAIREYESEDIMHWQQSIEYERLRELVDPYSYLDQLSLPKYIINAASDEFFLPDSWKFYWDDLQGDKYLRYIPNTGHSLSETDATQSLTAFYYSILNDLQLPVFKWEVREDRITYTFHTDFPPSSINLWRADNPDGRDFRLYVIDRTWQNRNISLADDGTGEIMIEEPSEGYSAYFVEAAFPVTDNLNIIFTSGVVVTPDTYPYPPFESSSPKGTIIE